jgi:hypothetical protein
MDMSRHLRKWLTERALAEQLGDEYEGVVAAASEETIRNRFTGQREQVPVVTFGDGWRLVLNKTILQKFIVWFGAESDNWVGRRVRVYRRQVEIANAKGVTRTKWVRDCVCEDRLARVLLPHRSRVVPEPDQVMSEYAFSGRNRPSRSDE